MRGNILISVIRTLSAGAYPENLGYKEERHPDGRASRGIAKMSGIKDRSRRSGRGTIHGGTLRREQALDGRGNLGGLDDSKNAKYKCPGVKKLTSCKGALFQKSARDTAMFETVEKWSPGRREMRPSRPTQQQQQGVCLRPSTYAEAVTCRRQSSSAAQVDTPDGDDETASVARKAGNRKVDGDLYCLAVAAKPQSVVVADPLQRILVLGGNRRGELLFYCFYHDPRFPLSARSVSAWALRGRWLHERQEGGQICTGELAFSVSPEELSQVMAHADLNSPLGPLNSEERDKAALWSALAVLFFPFDQRLLGSHNGNPYNCPLVRTGTGMDFPFVQEVEEGGGDWVREVLLPIEKCAEIPSSLVDTLVLVDKDIPWDTVSSLEVAVSFRTALRGVAQAVTWFSTSIEEKNKPIESLADLKKHFFTKFGLTEAQRDAAEEKLENIVQDVPACRCGAQRSLVFLPDTVSTYPVNFIYACASLLTALAQGQQSIDLTEHTYILGEAKADEAGTCQTQAETCPTLGSVMGDAEEGLGELQESEQQPGGEVADGGGMGDGSDADEDAEQERARAKRAERRNRREQERKEKRKKKRANRRGEAEENEEESSEEDQPPRRGRGRPPGTFKKLRLQTIDRRLFIDDEGKEWDVTDWMPGGRGPASDEAALKVSESKMNAVWRYQGSKERWGEEHAKAHQEWCNSRHVKGAFEHQRQLEQERKDRAAVPLFECAPRDEDFKFPTEERHWKGFSAVFKVRGKPSQAEAQKLERGEKTEKDLEDEGFITISMLQKRMCAQSRALHSNCRHYAMSVCGLKKGQKSDLESAQGRAWRAGGAKECKDRVLKDCDLSDFEDGGFWVSMSGWLRGDKSCYEGEDTVHVMRSLLMLRGAGKNWLEIPPFFRSGKVKWIKELTGKNKLVCIPPSDHPVETEATKRRKQFDPPQSVSKTAVIHIGERDDGWANTAPPLSIYGGAPVHPFSAGDCDPQTKRMHLMIYSNLSKGQATLLNMLNGLNVEREFMLVCDPFGNRGKSQMSSFLQHTLGDACVVLSGGTFSELCYLMADIYTKRKSCPAVVCVDVARAVGEPDASGRKVLLPENICQFCEKLRDGVLVTPKYTGLAAYPLNKTKVIVFTNCAPNYVAISKDAVLWSTDPCG
uniref:Uncharacterized protein n=1 Tax=Chromera velia CCMP2878 TaxID=1169474 RepID=A0A0G4G4S5_9ALVE|eukprot:Cvel_20246.t1-p1 / transcript=Cvel_20246.t1 / gene=Cvel_20246 / organism=Chromera_velia_CCMP2878 / gene_product=hypothetical protein / transcript_product=hypothetical protein / location=Cvel_scaffold1804:25328-36280(+) / protein_length=1144 / sequence_SO=supercontig / SO=protein_coding / is_pseudo=false